MTDAPKLGLDQCTEIMKEHGGKMTTALATLLLACQLQVANAQSVPRVVGPGEHRTDIIGAGELPKNVIVLPGGTATTEKGQWTVTTSVSTSASAAVDKKDGGQLSIELIEEFKKATPDQVEDWEKPKRMAYRKFIMEEKAGKVATISDIDQKKGEKVATGQKLDATNEQKVATGQKLDATNEQKVATISAYQTIDRYQKILLTGGSLAKNDKIALKEALTTPGVDPKFIKSLSQYTL